MAEYADQAENVFSIERRNERPVEAKDRLLEDFANSQPILFDNCQLAIEAWKSCDDDLLELLRHTHDPRGELSQSQSSFMSYGRLSRLWATAMSFRKTE